MIDWFNSLDEANKIAVIGIILAIVLPIVGYLLNIYFKRRRKLKAYYELTGKKSSRLKPTDILKERGEQKYGFNNYYYNREIDTKLSESVSSGKHTIIIGNPIAGKTRAVFNTLKKLNKSANVIAPRLIDINTEDFLIPNNISFWRKKVLLLDDIDKYVQRTNFQYLLGEFLKNDILIIATCRTGQELETLRSVLETQFSTIFQNILEIRIISDKEEVEIAKDSDVSISKNFDGNIGSIFLELDAMRERYKHLDETQRGILRSFKKLYFGGVYNERENFNINYIKMVCKSIEEIELKEFEWKNNINFLESQKFVRQVDDYYIWAEEVYLQFIVDGKFSIIDNIKKLKIILEGELEALQNLALHAYNIGNVVIEKKEYITLSISIYMEILKTYLFDRFPIAYAMIKNNLGNAFRSLAEVDDRSEFCRKAIDAFKDSLNIYTIERFPILYATTQNNLGVSYRTLAEVENKYDLCLKSIEAFEEALKVYSFQKFPFNYAMTQNNLGTAYGVLSEVSDRYKHCGKAILAFEEALKVYSFQKFPRDYAMLQSNLGNTYALLAQVIDNANVIDRSEYCKKAISSFKDALRVRSIEKFPLDYSETQNNLGLAYFILGTIEHKSEYSREAIKTFKEALKIRVLEKFPIDYAITQNNLGLAYKNLAEIDNKSEFSEKAIKAFEEALRIFTLQKYPAVNERISNNLANIKRFYNEHYS